ncbi:MAG TPA: metallophosphoesterase [Mycobacterium sp.]
MNLIPPVPETKDAGSTKRSNQLRDRMYWFRLSVLWGSRNDALSRLSDPVPELRRRWINGRGTDELLVDLSDRDSFSFLLMGDTGEGDYSQYAVVPPLCRVADASSPSFVIICSDILYPVGNINEYGDKFYQPYRTLPAPIYTIPGNHDWYDDLTAFMANFGHPETLPPPPEPDPRRPQRRGLARTWDAVRSKLRDALWRRPTPAIDPAAIHAARSLRGQPAQQQPAPQPGPYYVIDTKYLRLVCIDTGIRGHIDEDQGRWLIEVSSDPRPKILITGKPLLVDGTVHPCSIANAPDGFESVLSVVHSAGFNYVAVIGGDVHNYQHYPATVVANETTRTIHHIVSGGGGAFMHATHLVPIIDPAEMFGVTEQTYKAYPLRRDSLAAYSHVVQGMLDRLLPRRLRPNVTLDDTQAAEVLHRKLGTPLDRPAQPAPPGSSPTRASISAHKLRLSGLILKVGGRRFHNWFSPFCDWDDPPFFKHFLRIDVRVDGATITCHAATGCVEHEAQPPIEDVTELTWDIAPTVA